jgi:hypothetical protein
MSYGVTTFGRIFGRGPFGAPGHVRDSQRNGKG